MAHLDHKGPEGKGPKTGRKLGLCKKEPNEKNEYGLGNGMCKHRKNPAQINKGKGKRLQAGKLS